MQGIHFNVRPQKHVIYAHKESLFRKGNRPKGGGGWVRKVSHLARSNSFQNICFSTSLHSNSNPKILSPTRIYVLCQEKNILPGTQRTRITERINVHNNIYITAQQLKWLKQYLLNYSNNITIVFFESLAHDSGRTLVCAEYGYPKGSPNTNS
jgi:hypothetical protein